MIPGAPAPQPAAAGGAPMPAPAPQMPAQPHPAPGGQQMPPQAVQPPAPPPAPMQTVFDAETFGAALQLLKDQRHRGFRIEIETDSTVMSDMAMEQKAATEMVQALGAFMQSSMPMAQAMPQIMPLMGKVLLFMVRRFKAGVELEGAIEDALDKLESGSVQGMQNPKAQETQAKQQLDLQKAQLDAQQSQQAHSMDLQARAVGLQADMVKAKAEMTKAVADEQHAQMQHQRDMALVQAQGAAGVGGQPLMPQHLQFGAGTITGNGQ